MLENRNGGALHLQAHVPQVAQANSVREETAIDDVFGARFAPGTDRDRQRELNLFIQDNCGRRIGDCACANSLRVSGANHDATVILLRACDVNPEPILATRKFPGPLLHFAQIDIAAEQAKLLLVRIPLALVFVAAVAFASPAGDWPHWRGPHWDGTTPEELPVPWPKDGPQVIWQASVGIGFSSISVSHGRAYTMGNTNEQDTIWCFDAQKGNVLWKHSYLGEPRGLPRT